MRIVIDMQGAQTESRFRGIGRYTLSFVQAVTRNRGEHEVILVLNGLLLDTIEPIREAFDGLLAQQNICVWQAIGPVRDGGIGNDIRRETAELLREEFIASLQPDIIHVTSMFEGFVDDAVTSISLFDKSTPVSVSLYDFIPLLNSEHYLKPYPRYEQYYQRKIENLQRAAIYLVISNSSLQEGVGCLSKPKESFVNISAAVEPYFQIQPIDNVTAIEVRQKFGINTQFVLYTGGADERKNLPRLIEAYSVLPSDVRTSYQLVLAGKMSAGSVIELRELAISFGLKYDELCFTGYVSDSELLKLYNMCDLYILPSWHEGFGLPALEAMTCGAPVIAANTSSLPEVIGLDSALFDPFDISSISQKMANVLQNVEFRSFLRDHGIIQAKKFSWDETAKRAIIAWETLIESWGAQLSKHLTIERKPKLAFVSPLPPARTGIADYSAGLLPALSRHYEIELIVTQDNVAQPWNSLYGQLRDVTWLREHASEVDRVLYQIGNSPFHLQMLTLLEEIPGAVVLHDFYMSGLISWLEQHCGQSYYWARELYASHGYGAVCDRYQDPEAAKNKYPVNWSILQHAQGVIVHSEYSLSLAQEWFNNDSLNFEVIPLLRLPAESISKQDARKKLCIADDAFIVCSFGFLDASKLNHRLVQAWLKSALASHEQSYLFFVGENHGGDYGTNLLKIIDTSAVGERIKITGFVSSEVFQLYLAAADFAVQLRTNSRGETSAAVLDCMNYSLPVIVNANGSMIELDSEAVLILPNEFSDEQLVDGLEMLWSKEDNRQSLGVKAKQVIIDYHNPERCAKLYQTAIERFHLRTTKSISALINEIARQKIFDSDDVSLIELSSKIAATFPLRKSAKCLFLDVTATCRNDLKTGIERATRAFVLGLLNYPPEGYRIEPVYLCDTGGNWHYRYARKYTLELLGCPNDALLDEPVAPENGDILLGLDISGDILIQAEKSFLFNEYRNLGVLVYCIVYDLLPIRMPEMFPPKANENHRKWLNAISTFDGAICISKTVADDFAKWQIENNFKWNERRPYQITHSYLGADIVNSAPSIGLPDNIEYVLTQIALRPSFLMVGTIEPRKGYQQVLEAFGQLWAEGDDINLIIVGSEGWKGLPEEKRRDIPQTVEYLRDNTELDKRLFWLENISDEYLEKVYQISTCLIAASYGEGFGLPLIEAAQHKLPIIARDISIFREVAGDFSYYFQGNKSDDLSRAIRIWLELYQIGKHPKSDGMSWLTWKKSVENLINVVLMNNLNKNG